MRNDFFQVLQLPVRAGRTFDAGDKARPPRVTVIDEDLAQALFGQASPIGRHVGFDQGGPDVEVIGVVGRVWLGGNRPTDRRPTLYFPGTARRADFDPENIELRGSYRDTYTTTIAVRYRNASTPIVAAIRHAVAEIDPNLVVIDPKTVAEIIAHRLEPTRVVASLWLAFGCATLSMTLLGLFGTMSYAVTQRTKEIAIRVALGASRRSVVQMVIGQIAQIAALGIAGGILISAIAVPMIRSHLFGVSSYDPATIAGMTILVMVVCAGAAIVPVRRALRIQPSSALRWD